MSDYQFFKQHQSINNNIRFKYQNTQSNTFYKLANPKNKDISGPKSNKLNKGYFSTYPYDLNTNESHTYRIQIPFGNTPSTELRNYYSKRQSNSHACKQNEIENLNSFAKAAYYSNQTKIDQENIEILNENNLNAIRNEFTTFNKAREAERLEDKRQLEEDIINIISYALKFTKRNNPIKAMMNNDMTKNIAEIKQNRMACNNSPNREIESFVQGSSLGSFINTSKTNMKVKYDANQFLNALGLDLNNLNPNNIKINIDSAMELIAKWKVKDKEKIRKLIRMRVINEISSIEERRIVKKLEILKSKISNLVSKKEEIDKSSRETYTILVNDKQIEKSKSENIIKSKEKARILDGPDKRTKTQVLKSSQDYKSTKAKTISKSNSVDTRFNKQISNIEKSVQNHQKSKARRKVDTYKSIDKLILYAESNLKIKQNVNLMNHFRSVRLQKQADGLIGKVLLKNKLSNLS